MIKELSLFFGGLLLGAAFVSIYMPLGVTQTSDICNQNVGVEQVNIIRAVYMNTDQKIEIYTTGLTPDVVATNMLHEYGHYLQHYQMGEYYQYAGHNTREDFAEDYVSNHTICEVN
jgi:hypothetical protein